MIMRDRVGNEWKISADEEQVHIHVQRNPAPESMVTVPAGELKGYYGLGAGQRDRFRQELGMRIGLPLWPLFVKTSFEAELEHLRALGVFGTTGGEETTEDTFDLLVPMTIEEAVQRRPEIAPGEEELEAHARERRLYREGIREYAVCAVCVRLRGLEELKDEAVRERMESAGSRIECCVVCLSPATHVGIHTQEGELLLHGLCRFCLPRETEHAEELSRTIREALEEQMRSGAVRTIPEEDPS
jgi:hypothetical protein